MNKIYKNQKYYALEFWLDAGELVLIGFYSRWCKRYGFGEGDLREVSSIQPITMEKVFKAKQWPYSILNTQDDFDIFVQNGAQGKIIIREEVINHKCPWVLNHPFGVLSDHDWAEVSFHKEQRLFSDLQNKFAEQKINHERELSAAKLAERDQILRSLSHRIKNIVNRLASPLRQLKEHVNATEIDKALKGAELIREIINGFNYSYSGSFEDFVFDAKNSGKDCASFDNILIDSTVPAIENMLDGKWFKAFLDQYFPDRASFLETKNAWNKLNDKSLSSLETFFRNSFMDCSIKTKNIRTLRIGDTKGSALKFMILFQELILNAVKYASFVERDKRFMKIDLSYKAEDGLFFEISNSFDPEIQEKETGLGHVIIETMCKLMNAGYSKKINPAERIFTISISFPDYWNNKGIQHKVFYQSDSKEPEYKMVSEKKSDYDQEQ